MASTLRGTVVELQQLMKAGPWKLGFCSKKRRDFLGVVLLIWPCISIFTNSFFGKNIFSTVLGPQFSHGVWFFFLDGILAMAVLFHVLVGVDSGLFKLIV